MQDEIDDCGSSPRPWGTPKQPAWCRRSRRFIPTSVGNTQYAQPPSARHAVHPHVRGEHIEKRGDDYTVDGSSPRPWGTLSATRRAVWFYRFIPTSVGNTASRTGATTPATVHPHVRGEHWIHQPAAPRTGGSSPRPWGTLVRFGQLDHGERFIPTSVGNTSWSIRSRCMTTVHPHVRGEHPKRRMHPAVAIGSSPRPWGTRKKQPQQNAASRFIPTSVGNTPPGLATAASSSVHPHVRGEHASVAQRFTLVTGSSPRPWGTLNMRSGNYGGRRFIPTSVGNT